MPLSDLSSLRRRLPQSVLLLMLLLVSAAFPVRASPLNNECEAFHSPFNLHWTCQERWAWNEILTNDGGANFDNIYGELDLDQSDDLWSDQGAKAEKVRPRLLTAHFLLDIFTDPQLTKAIPSGGVQIIGAWFEDAVDLSNVHSAGPLRLEHTIFNKGLWLKRAKVDGFLSLDRSVFGSNPEKDRLEVEFGDKISLNLKGLEAGSNIFLRRAHLKDDVLIVGARVGRTLEVDGSTFDGKLDMGGLTTGESLYLRDFLDNRNRNITSSEFKGPVTLAQAKIGHNLDAPNANFHSDFNLNGSGVADNVILSGSHFTGRVEMGGIHIGKSLYMETDGRSGRLTIFGELHDLKPSKGNNIFIIEGYITDSIVARDVLIGGDLNMSRINVGHSLDLKNSIIFGNVDLIDAKIENDLDPRKAFFGQKVTLTGAKAGEVRIWPDTPDAHSLELEGLTYERVQPPDDVPGPSLWYIDWLRRDPHCPSQAYQQLATVLRAAGGYDQANNVLYEGLECQRRQEKTSWSRWAGLSLLNVTIGYGIGSGYFRILIWVMFFTLLGGWLLAEGKEFKRSDSGKGVTLSAKCSLRSCFFCIILVLEYGVLIYFYLFYRDLPRSSSESTLLVLGCFSAFMIVNMAVLQSYQIFMHNGSRLNNGLSEARLHGLWAKLTYSLQQLLPIIILEKSYDDIELEGCIRWYFYAHKLVGWILGLCLAAGMAGLTQGK